MSKPAVNPARYGGRQAQPIDLLIRQAGGVTKGLFDQRPENMDAASQAVVEEASRIKAIAARKFLDPDGIALLEFLCDGTVRRPVALSVPGMSRDQAFDHALTREGHNQAIYWLLGLIAEGRNEQKPQREGSDK